MKPNVGTADRIIRIIIGIVLISLFFILDNNWKYLGILGIVMLLVGIVRFCPLYTIFKISTCPVKR